MEDIEDLASAGLPERVEPSARGVGHRVTARSKAPQPSDGEQAHQIGSGEHSGDSGGVPGSHSIYVKTYGCSHNSADSEYMCGLLAQYGYRLMPESQKEAADVWLINSCTVKNPSEEHMATDIKRGRALGKSLVVAGCVSQAQPDLPALNGISIIGVQQIERVVEVVQEALRGSTVRLLSRASRPSLDLPKVRRNPLIEIVACNTGCLGSCTYCKTVYARGKLGSYEPSALRRRVECAFHDDGVVEVWLTSEDTGAYGRDIGSSMPALMATLLDAVPDGGMLRVGMTNPPYMLEHIDAIATLLNHPRCYAFLHVPVQSGADSVLHRMRREYTVADFCRVADTLLAAVPDLTLATDIICGFPGETEADHDATLALVAKYKFPVLNISQFYPRQGTPAAKMTRVPTGVVKSRTREVSQLFRSYQTFDYLVGSEQRCLVTEIAHDGVSLVGHTKGYVQVLLPSDPQLMGCMLRVRITDAAKFYVKATVLEVLHTPPRAEVARAVIEQKQQLLPKKTPPPPPQTPVEERHGEPVAGKGCGEASCGSGDCGGGDCGGGDCGGGDCGGGDCCGGGVDCGAGGGDATGGADASAMVPIPHAGRSSAATIASTLAAVAVVAALVFTAVKRP